MQDREVCLCTGNSNHRQRRRVAALGLLALPLAAKGGPMRGRAGGPEGIKLAPVASQLQLSELGHGCKVQTVSHIPPYASLT